MRRARIRLDNADAQPSGCYCYSRHSTQHLQGLKNGNGTQFFGQVPAKSVSIPRAQANAHINAHITEEEALAPAPSSLAPWKIRCAQAFVAANLHSAIRVVDIAKAANCGRTQLKRVFEESFGYTPYQYVIRRRVARAQNLMLSSNDSLCDIATECGFASASALSRLFRQIVGESPSTWRRVHETASRPGPTLVCA